MTMMEFHTQTQKNLYASNHVSHVKDLKNHISTFTKFVTTKHVDFKEKVQNANAYNAIIFLLSFTTVSLGEQTKCVFAFFFY